MKNTSKLIEVVRVEHAGGSLMLDDRPRYDARREDVVDKVLAERRKRREEAAGEEAAEGGMAELAGDVVEVVSGARECWVRVVLPRGSTVDLRRFEGNAPVTFGPDLDAPPIGQVASFSELEEGVIFRCKIGKGEQADRVAKLLTEGMLRGAALVGIQRGMTLEVTAVSLRSVSPKELPPEARARTRKQREADQAKAEENGPRFDGRANVDPVTEAVRARDAHAATLWQRPGGRR